MHIWKGALNLARGRLANGMVAKLPSAALLQHGDGLADTSDLRTYALNVAVLLKFWGQLTTSLAQDLLKILDELFGLESGVLERIMHETEDNALPGLFTPASPGWQISGVADKYHLAAYLCSVFWSAAQQYATDVLHVNMDALRLSDQLHLLAVTKVDVDVGAVKHLMQKDEEPVRSLAAVAQELNAMAEGKHFDFERMNSIMAEMAHAKVCLERNRERRRRCNSRTPGSIQ